MDGMLLTALMSLALLAPLEPAVTVTATPRKVGVCANDADVSTIETEIEVTYENTSSRTIRGRWQPAYAESMLSSSEEEAKRQHFVSGWSEHTTVPYNWTPPLPPLASLRPGAKRRHRLRAAHLFVTADATWFAFGRRHWMTVVFAASNSLGAEEPKFVGFWLDIPLLPLPLKACRFP
jgi:hypothetical protein